MASPSAPERWSSFPPAPRSASVRISAWSCFGSDPAPISQTVAPGCVGPSNLASTIERTSWRVITSGPSSGRTNTSSGTPGTRARFRSTSGPRTGDPRRRPIPPGRLRRRRRRPRGRGRRRPIHLRRLLHGRAHRPAHLAPPPRSRRRPGAVRHQSQLPGHTARAGCVLAAAGPRSRRPDHARGAAPPDHATDGQRRRGGSARSALGHARAAAL